MRANKALSYEQHAEGGKYDGYRAFNLEEANLAKDDITC